jgi:hypothetical protein
VPRFNQQGGTRVVPGHGRILNEADVVEYRDMMTIIYDRIKKAVGDGESLARSAMGRRSSTTASTPRRGGPVRC